MTLIPAHAIRTIWPRVNNMLAPAIERGGGRYTAESLQRALADEQMQLWLIYEGTDLHCAIVTSVVEYPALKAVAIVLLGGDGRHAWTHIVQDTLTSFAKDVGADKIEVTGRRGWARDARKFGYTSPAHVFEYTMES